MKVLVTGSAGFLGSHLVRQLTASGHDVMGLDQLEAVESGFTSGRLAGKPLTRLGDITYDLEHLFPEGKHFDCVIHLAAIAAPSLCDKDPALAFNQNVQGTHNVLKLALKVGAKKVVFASSAHVYGISPKYMPTDENHPLATLDTYTTTKLLGEQLCELFWQNYGLSYIAIRLFNGYGPGQPAGYFIPDKIKQAMAGDFSLRGSMVTKDWVYINDVVRAYSRAAESEFVGPINIGTGQEGRLVDVAGIIATEFNVHLKVEAESVGGPTRMCADWRRAKDVLGWEPEVTLLEGLKKTIQWWKDGHR